MTKLIATLDRASETVGRILALASLAIMALTFIVVVIRYGLNSGSIQLGGFRINAIAIQETVMYLHAMLFMLASAYTLKHNAHVRVDVFYRNFSPKTKAWVDIMGTLLLLFPMSGFILYMSLDFVAFAWQIQEHSGEAEGLPYVYVLKTLIPIMAGMLLFQGLVEVLRNTALLMGKDVAASQQEAELI